MTTVKNKKKKTTTTKKLKKNTKHTSSEEDTSDMYNCSTEEVKEIQRGLKVTERRGEAAGEIERRRRKDREITSVCEITNSGINSAVNLLSISVCFPTSSSSLSPPSVPSPFLCRRFHSGKQLFSS